MTKLDRSYEPHLETRELFLPPEVEWAPRFPGWTLCQIGSGSGYWLHPQLNQELETGTVLLLSAEARGAIRASQLGGGLSLYFFNVEPDRLTGLIALSEQLFFAAAAAREKIPLQILPPHSPVAVKMKELCANQNRTGCLFRLQLLQVFIEVFGNELRQEVRPEPPSDATERLRGFLKQTPASDLLHMNFAELVQITRCTPRHLSRVFREVVGMSFRAKHAELRLVRARELLATTESKVVDVALESGFQSLSLFNLMFKRRFGLSPGKWRRKRQNNKVSLVRFATEGNQTIRFPATAPLSPRRRTSGAPMNVNVNISAQQLGPR